MKKTSKYFFALTGLAVLCVCAAMASPTGMGDGDGRAMMNDDGDRLQIVITKLQENNVDTTALEAAIADGDREAVRAFLEANRPADAPEPRNNGVWMQQVITKLQEKGVDTTALEAAIADGNREAVREFLKANCDGSERQQNAERMEQVITKLQENGVDTTALEAAIADGNREAVHAFLQENRPADAPDAGTGFCHGGQQSDA